MSDQEALTPPPPIHLDGTTLEGGGQLLRLALSVSSLTHIPIHVTNIRGKRGRKSAPGKDGGLKPAHLAGVQWLAGATQAETQGMEVKSKELVFRPSSIAITAATEEWQGKHPDRQANNEGLCVWKDITLDGMIIRREGRISMASPGAITLILQAILPYLLFSSSVSANDPRTAVPLRVTIEGGTNVSNSPSIEYVDQVLLPLLTSKLGTPPVSMTLHQRGWSTGRIEIGSVTFDISPLKPKSSIPAFKFQERGQLMKVHVSIIAPGAVARSSIREHVTVQLLAYDPEVEILFPVDEDSGGDKRLYLLLVAETSNGYRLGRDWSQSLGSTVREKGEKLVSKVVKDLKRELKNGGCVDEYMQDQLVVFQALAAGEAEVDGGKRSEATLHTKTARWVAEKVLGVKFDRQGRCKGVGFVVGEDFQGRNRTEEDANKTMAGLQI